MGQHDSPAELERQLQAYHDAIRGEFAARSAVAADTAELEKQIRQFYRDNTASAAARIVWLSQNADSEAIQFAACKYVQDMGLSEAKRAPEDDPIYKLVAKLHKNDKATSTKATSKAGSELP